MVKLFLKNSAFILFLSLLSVVGCVKGKDDNIPQKLGGLELLKVVRGDEADDFVNKMHGKKLGVKKNLIAYYGSKNSRNILYISVYEKAEEAKADLQSMAIKMAQGTAVFTPLKFDKMENGVRFRTEGMGLIHYFYRVDNILIWWQVEPDKADSTISDLFNFNLN
ncbi:MAG: hypothetical protein SRB1_02676 [Desulfobacteraceae bacterium Eth-SRB1]|nr:MAG: hypothetical protein SRB1_02676 [Desulfobacteraceae bacterium Eth-SRB1]